MRKGNTKRRTIKPDVVYKSELVTRLINRVMKDGKKTVAERNVYGALESAEKQLQKDPAIILEDVIDKIRPRVEVRPRRIGGAAYQVPLPVNPIRSRALAIRWLVLAARSKPNSQYHTFIEKLAAEIVDTYNNQGGALAKKQEVERIAEANRAFSHLRW